MPTLLAEEKLKDTAGFVLPVCAEFGVTVSGVVTFTCLVFNSFLSEEPTVSWFFETEELLLTSIDP